MLNFCNVALRQGTRQLFAHANFTLHAGNKIGLTGANGTGKSSLFAALRGQLELDEGEIDTPPNLTIAHVAQETPACDESALEYTLAGDTELRSLQCKLNQAEKNHDAHRIAALHAQLNDINAYAAPSRAAKLLNGLGFDNEAIHRSVDTFSGGWRMRLNLAQALMCRSDLLLLDEPTNHLDLEAIIWLEKWLIAYSGTLILISHDRDFLDNVVGHIIHIEHHKIKIYTGNYSQFERARAEALAQQQANHLKQQREIAHIRSFIERFKAKASKARQAQSRVKALNKIALISAAHVDSPFHFSFFEPEKMPLTLLSIKNASAGYTRENPIIKNLKLTLIPENRIGLLGPNGAGKSTLIKLLANEDIKLEGEITTAATLKTGYFAQHQLEQLHLSETAIDHLQALDPEATTQSLQDFLGRFGFTGERARVPIRPFSGGEKARLVLALIVYQRPNLLLLDEPTNHLDLEMRHALTVALQSFTGALVVISHDRHLLRAVCDQFILVSDGEANTFEGDIDDYEAWLSNRHRDTEPTQAQEIPSITRKDQRRLDAEKRQRLQPIKNELKQVEKNLEKIQQQKAKLEHTLANNEIYTDVRKSELKELLSEQTRITKQAIQLEERWLTLSEQLENDE